MSSESSKMHIPLRRFSLRSGLTIDFSEVGFGASPLGNLYRSISEPEAQQALAAAWDAGIRYFDTAPLYGFGLAETRLNQFLRGKARDSYIVATKVGRLLKRARESERDGVGKFYETPSRKEVFDYGYDGVMRSVEDSLERLGLDRLDIIYAHDLDVFTHGSKAASSERVNEFMKGGYKALVALREEGVVKAIGAGVNEWQVCEELAQRGDFDVFLLAGRYTLLEQEAVESFLPMCLERQIAVVIGGPFNSGILATGPIPGAYYDYAPAPEVIKHRVSQIQQICESLDVRLVEAALQFPVRHPAVYSVIPGAMTAIEVERNVGAFKKAIPEDLWELLKRGRLIRADAPV